MNSCKRKLGLYAIMCMTFCIGNNIHAEATKDNPIVEDTISESHILSFKIPEKEDRIAGKIDVITKKDIKNLPVKTVNDLLKYISGVDVRQRGSFGAQTDISIRGGNFDQIALLINGINVTDYHTGHNSFNLPTDIEDIERIEIINGPAAMTYGVSSLSGIINIITKKDKNLSIRAEGGSHNYHNWAGRLSGQYKKISGSISAGVLSTDGHVFKAGQPLTDLNKINAFSTLSYDDKRFSATIQGGFFNSNFGANTFYSPKFDNQFEHVQKVMFSAGGHLRGKINIIPSIYYLGSTDRFELFRDAPSKYPFNYHHSNSLGSNLNVWFKSFIGKTFFGMEYRFDNIISTKLGTELKNPIKIKGTDRFYDKGKSRHNLNLYAGQNFDFKYVNANIGIKAFRNFADNEGFTFYPNADISLKIKNFILYTSYSSSFRMPTFTDLFYSDPSHVSNEYLKTEKIQAFEGGMNYFGHGISIKTNIFYQIGKDFIDRIKYDKDGAGAKWQSFNFASINNFGQSMIVDVKPDIISGNAIKFWKSFKIDYQHISQSKNNIEGIQSKYVLEYPKHKLVISSMFEIKYLYFNFAYRYVDRNGKYTVFDKDTPGGRPETYKPYNLFDMKMGVRYKNIDVFAEAVNLFNSRYFDYGNVVQPGRLVRMGICYRLNP